MQQSEGYTDTTPQDSTIAEAQKLKEAQEVRVDVNVESPVQ